MFDLFLAQIVLQREHLIDSVKIALTHFRKPFVMLFKSTFYVFVSDLVLILTEYFWFSVLAETIGQGLKSLFRIV